MVVFGTEQDEVLLSLQLAVTWEAEADSGNEPSGQDPPSPVAGLQVRYESEQAAPQPAPPPFEPMPAAPGAALIDRRTGAGTLKALRSDLLLEHSWPSRDGNGFMVLVATVEPVARLRASGASETAENVLKALAELAPFVLRASDKVYRAGRDRMAFLLCDTDGVGAEVAMARVEGKTNLVLEARGFPSINLTSQVMSEQDLARLIGGAATGAWAESVAARILAAAG